MKLMYAAEKKTKAIIDSLSRNDGIDARVYSVIRIVGMGGIGKTTLAQLVYNYDSIKDHFDVRAWVCVSDNFDITRITKTILRSVTSEPCDMNDLNSLQLRLKEKLPRKKFFLVLDDIWNEKYTDWEKLWSPFDAWELGSKIILTTETAVSALFEAFLGKFLDSSTFEFVTEKRVRKEIENWQTILRDIRDVLADAEEKQMRDKHVKNWLAELQDLAYDVDDILDEFATEALARKLMKEHEASTSKAQNFKPTCCTGLHPSSIMFNYKMMSKIREVTGRLKDLKETKSLLQLNSWVTNDVGRPMSMTITRRPESTSLVNEADVHGRDNDKKAILDLLLKNDGVDARVYSVIPIVGMGGIGKTTLAQLVYNDDSIKDHFDLRAWVCVSDDFDVARITKTILRSVASEPCDMNDLNSLQVKLKEKLSRKKFLLVLDDVWNEKYTDWEKLRSPFDAGELGSKIIVTTRSSIVSSIMKTVEDYSMQCLSEEDSLDMLAQVALGRKDFTGRPDLKEIGWEIVKKCGNLPFATKTIGGLLRTKVNRDAWKDILKSDIWSLPREKSDISPALWLSYYYLPPELKQCFAYCSLIPKDYEFNEEEIVPLWMAEGFLSGANTKRESEDLSSKYFQELVSRSFFQASSKDKSQFVMHDLINDLAQFVGGEKYFKRERDEEMKSPRRTRHSSYIMGKHEENKKFETFFEANSLRTFLPFWMQPWNGSLSKKVLNDLFARLKCLRVLSLKGYDITEIPCSIGNLRHLRYLNFSYTMIKCLPDSICTLYKLETLLLRGCQELRELPLKIEILDNLYHLDISGAYKIREMPSGIGKLTNLQSLSNFIVGQDDALNIREMQNLSNLKGQLSISWLMNVNDAQDAEDAELSNKPDLHKLTLKWSWIFNENLRKKEVETEVLKLLQPHESLKVLAIKNYAGIAFPIWIMDPSVKKLQSLNLKNCQICPLLPAAGNLPLLKDLYISGARSVTSVGHEFYGENWSNAFPLLETLHFEDMPEWEEWKACEVDDQARKFRCLRDLHIVNCPKLTGTLPKYLLSLEKLDIRSCPNLVVSISNLPKLCELEIDGCEKAVVGSCLDLWSVKEVTLSNISKFACLTREMMILEPIKVENLSVSGCEELVSLWQTEWDWLVPLRSLRNLVLENCPLVVSIGGTEKEEKTKLLHNFTCLTELKIVNCPKLVSLSADNFPSTVKSLNIVRCGNLRSLLEDEENINFSSSSLLESLGIYDCNALKSLSSSNKLLVRLKKLEIISCPEIEFVAQEIGDNNCLEEIAIKDCKNIRYLPQGVDKLKTLDLSRCEKLEALPSLYSLQKLAISDCPRVTSLPSVYSLQELRIWDCPRVTSIPEGGLPAVTEGGLHTLKSLTFLCIGDSDDVSFPPEEIKLPSSLNTLNIMDFKKLRKLSSKGFQYLSSLQLLWIGGCPKLKSLPKKEMLPSLLNLGISGCPELKKRCKRDKGKYWSYIADIPHVEIDRNDL